MMPSLKTYVEKKFSSLEKFIGKLEKESEAEIFLEISRITKHHHKGVVFSAEADLKLAGIILRAEANSEDARVAIDLIKDELKNEILRFKEKQIADRRRQISA